MASIYKRGQDKGKKGACWYIGWTDHRGKWRTKKGFTDKGLTKELADKLISGETLRRLGLVDPESDRIAEHRNAAIEAHLKAFQASLAGNTPKHIKLIMARIRLVVAGSDIHSLGDISAEDVRSCIERHVTANKLGNRTYNHYVQAFDEFCKWLVVNKRMLSNPVLGLGLRNAEVDIRHKRRALTSDEVSKLVDAARKSDISIQCYDGETRARIYILSYMTGLRRSEIASLTPRSFAIDAEPPTVTVEAAFSKHRRRDVLPLHPELVIMLRAWLRGVPPDQPLFPGLAKRRTWYMVKTDLALAGIPYETPEGVADFHAAGRHTHITELLRNGATLPQAKELARHSDVKMTMRYTHIGIEDQAKALKQLPWHQTPAGEGTKPVSPTASSWECPGSETGGRNGRTTSSSVHADPTRDEPFTPSNGSNDKGCRNSSSTVTVSKKTSNSFDSRRLHFSPPLPGGDFC